MFIYENGLLREELFTLILQLELIAAFTLSSLRVSFLNVKLMNGILFVMV